MLAKLSYINNILLTLQSANHKFCRFLFIGKYLPDSIQYQGHVFKPERHFTKIKRTVQDKICVRTQHLRLVASYVPSIDGPTIITKLPPLSCVLKSVQ